MMPGREHRTDGDLIDEQTILLEKLEVKDLRDEYIIMLTHWLLKQLDPEGRLLPDLTELIEDYRYGKLMIVEERGDHKAKKPPKKYNSTYIHLNMRTAPSRSGSPERKPTSPRDHTKETWPD